MFLLPYARKNPKLEHIMIQYFEVFFYAESEQRMRLLEYFIDKIPINSLEDDRILLNLYQSQSTLDIDRKLTALSKYNGQLAITDYLKNKIISYITSGSTTSVFKVNDEVLKLSLQKHELTTEKDLFLIAPTRLQVIYDTENNPILYVERQSHLSKSYHGKGMTKVDVENFFEELDRQGFQITDPLCLNGNFDNFGFLSDYHDANITGFTSHEELPDWFKERPIVLYDIDLVYRKNVQKKKIFPSC